MSAVLPGGNILDYFRARRGLREGLVISDPRPIEHEDALSSAAQVATIGICLMLFGVCLYLTRPVLMPLVAAFVISLTLAPLVIRAGRHHVPSWISATVLVLLLLVVAASVVTLIVAPATEWINRAPDVGAALREKLYVFNTPLNAVRELQNILMPAANNAVTVQESQLSMVTPVLAFLTPALTQIMIFFVSLLFFLAGHAQIRRYLPSLFSDRDTKLRVIRIANDINTNLASYLATVTMINIGLGVVVGLGAWAFGIPNPLIFGVLAAVLNYIPYVGPAAVVLVLLGVSLVTFENLWYALLPPVSFVVLTTIEGQILSPTILGARLPLSPLTIFIALVFWIWLWGPVGALLAVPLSIIARVVFRHMFPSDEAELPG
jgi:predicted PurR-regulated permease PerM